MNFQLLLTAIITLLTSFFIVKYIIKEIIANTFKRRDFVLIFLSLLYFIVTAIFFMWSSGIFEFNDIDFLIVYSSMLVFQTISLVLILYYQTKNKKVLYPLSFYLIIFLLGFLQAFLIHLIIPLSILIILFSFLIFSDNHRKTMFFLILYTTISLFSYLISLIWRGLIPSLNLLSSLLFLLFIISFLKSLRIHKDNSPNYFQEQESPLIHFLRYFIFLIILTNFIFIGTVSVHEFGHLLIATTTTCENTKIVYSLNEFPHTEVNCENQTSKNLWILGGITLPFLVGILLFFTGGVSIKEIALQIIGFNLIFSYLDIVALTLSKTVAIFAFLLGVALSMLSLVLLAKSRVTQ